MYVYIYIYISIFHLLFIFYFCGLTPYPTLNYNLLYYLSHFILSFERSVAWWQPAEVRSGISCVQGSRPSPLVVSVPLAPLF